MQQEGANDNGCEATALCHHLRACLRLLYLSNRALKKLKFGQAITEAYQCA